MPKSNAVWGIDIGQCALKALRCVPHEDPARITVDAFDFIEYPKILSQPDADPVALVQDALKQFLSRNKVRGDRVAISVPGQSGLARFIKLPPVESKKIPDIVHYEARQQIPFALEDVVWDYQQMAGGSEEDGFALETEVGLFAMKRDQAFRALKPFNEAAIEVDIVQLTPLALYNFVVFDQLQDLPPLDQYDPSDPPPSIIVISLGTDTTDLVITNGYRVWQRNIPLGGNQFTKALTKELKLTFTKAEHLKRNALKAEDPKAVFLAMRPVFNDLVNEVQRSISFFQSVDRSAKIAKAVTLGNAMKLRGLQKYLAQSLGYEMVDLEEYRGLSGPTVLGAPAFKENLLSFGVCYGLALQGLKRSALRTNLIPREIVHDRKLRAKKPWVVTAVACLLLAFGAGFFGYWRAWKSARADDKSEYGKQMKAAISKSEDVQRLARDNEEKYKKSDEEFEKHKAVGERLTDIGERRLMWIQMLEGVSQCLPLDPNPQLAAGVVDPDVLRANIVKSPRMYIDTIDCEKVPRVPDWFQTANSIGGGGAAGAPAADASGGTSVPKEVSDAAEGWIVQITGHHYHNEHKPEGAQYVRETFLKELGRDPTDPNKFLPGKKVKVSVIDRSKEPGKDAEFAPTKLKTVTISDLGVKFPTFFAPKSYRPENEELELPGAGGGGAAHGPAPAAGAGAGEAGAAAATSITVPRFDFVIQFWWQPSPQYSVDKQPVKPAVEGAAAAGGPAADGGRQVAGGR